MEGLEVELPRGWSVTFGGRGTAVRLKATYAASCGGFLHVTLSGGELAYEADALRAVDEAFVAARTLLEQLRVGAASGRVVCREDVRARRRVRR